MAMMAGTFLTLGAGEATGQFTCSGTTAIVCGQTQPGSIAIGEVDCFTFVASGGEVVNVDLSQGTSAVEVWELRDPDGILVASCSSNHCNAVLPAKPGTYTIQVFDSGFDQAFSYNLTLQGLSESFTCGTPIACGGTVSGSLAVGDTDTFTFAGIADEVVNIDLGDSPAADEMWQLYDPDGILVTNCSTKYCNGTLPKTGTYTIIVFDGSSNQAFSYNLTLQGLSEGITCGTPIACGGTVSGSLAVGDTDTFTFAGIADEVVNIDLSDSPSSNEMWQLYDPDGILVTDCSTRHCNGTLLKTGTYTIIVADGGSNQAFAYSLTLQGVSEGLTCGLPVACGQIGGSLIAGHTDAFTFSGAANQTMTIGLSQGTPAEERWELFAPNGVVVSPPGICSGTCNATLPLSGTYTVLVFDEGSDEPISPYTLTLTGIGLPEPYCVARPSSLGCTPAIGWSGTPSVSGADNFHLTATNVPGQTTGFLIWSRSPAPRGLTPGGIVLCLAHPQIESLIASGGTLGFCNGALDFHFSQALMAANNLAPGDVVYAQFVYLDAVKIRTTDALQFTVCN